MLSNGARSKATSLLESSSVRARIRKVLLQTSCTPFLKFPGNLFLSTSCRAGEKCNNYYLFFLKGQVRNMQGLKAFCSGRLGGGGRGGCFSLGQNTSNIKLWSDAAPCSMNTPLHSPFDPILYHRGFSIGTKPPNYREVWSEKPRKQ